MLKNQKLKCCLNGLIYSVRHNQYHLLHKNTLVSVTNQLWVQCLRLYATASSSNPSFHANKKPPNADVKIIIPNRIPRGPTSILEALANTVDRDPTLAAHYLIDDPSTLQFGGSGGKMVYLSEESGRNAAMHALNSWPKLFQHDPSAPTVEAFTPKILLEGDTEECLRERITLDMVKDAKKIYANMSSSGTPISDELKLMYLDMLCTYNCKDEEYYPTAGQTFFGSTETDAWRPDDNLINLFDELCGTYPQTYISLICGATKYLGHKKAHELYTQALEKKITFPIEVHNSILSGLITVFPDMEGLTKETERILVYLEEHGIRPNLMTFNHILCQLKLLPPMTPRYQYGLRVLKEMTRCGIKPSPASYLHMMNMIYRTKRYDRYTDLLRWTITDLQKQAPLQMRDPIDRHYFRVAMTVALSFNDAEAGHKLYKMAWKGLNKTLLGDRIDKYRFHNYYVLLAIQTEPLEKVMEIYSDICPKVINLEDEAMVALFAIIELYEGYQYVTQLFEDLKETNAIFYSENWKFTKVLTVKHVKPEIQKEFARIADGLYEFSQKVFNPRAKDMFSAKVFSHFIDLALNMDDVEKAHDWFTKYKELEHSKCELDDATTFVRLAKALIAENRLEDMMGILQALVDLKFKKEVAEILKDEKFPDEYRDRVGLLTVQVISSTYRRYQPKKQNPWTSPKNHRNNHQ